MILFRFNNKFYLLFLSSVDFSLSSSSSSVSHCDSDSELKLVIVLKESYLLEIEIVVIKFFKGKFTLHNKLVTERYS